MSWLDRLQEAAYTPAQGDRLTFDFENVSSEISLRGTAFEFANSNGTFIQRTGNSSPRYPLRIFIWGEDYDLRAAAFVKALAAPGVGTLEHPIYGTVSAVPFGDVRRRDDLKTAANQAIIEVTFWQTLKSEYPTPVADEGSRVTQAVDEYNTAASQQFEDAIGESNTLSETNLENSYVALLDTTTATLATIAAANDDVAAQFSTIEESIRLGINTLVGEPLTLAFQTAILLELPARSAATIADRLVAYNNLLQSIIGRTSATRQDFLVEDVYASTYIAGAVTAAINTTFLTRSGALEAAEYVGGMFSSLQTWRDDNYALFDAVDTGEQYQQLQEAVALCTGYLVAISFTLKRELRFTLDRDRSPVDLCYELYGLVDSELDFFIDSNNLTWEEHLEIKRGREIVYYR